MADKELLTVKEYADVAGVTQQAVYQRLNKGLAKFLVEVEGQKYIKVEALSELETKADQQPETEKQYQAGSDVSKLIDTLTQTIEILQGQLSVKDSQIKDLNARLEQALNNTAQSHYIAAQAQVQALDSGEPTEETTATTRPDTNQEEKKGFFKRLFGG